MYKVFLLTLVPLVLIADDVIVDQGSLSQYQTDNCARFNMLDFDGENYNPNTPDFISLWADQVILGESYTQEVWIYKIQEGSNVQKIIGTSYGRNSPPAIVLTNWTDDLTYGFGNGGAA